MNINDERETKMSENLLISVLGNRNSGKSYTWNTLFKQTVRTGTELRRLYLTDNEYVEVFLVSGSAEERKEYVWDDPDKVDREKRQSTL